MSHFFYPFKQKTLATLFRFVIIFSLCHHHYFYPSAIVCYLCKMNNRILLIFPPLAKACEPPAGIARIAGFLRNNQQLTTLWDANIEGQEYLLKKEQTPEDTWSKRAWKNKETNLGALRDSVLYKNQDRYQRAIRDLNRTLSQSCKKTGININLADYQDTNLSAHQSTDLLYAAQNYKQSIFYPFFKQRLSELFADNDTGFIGISLNYLSQALVAFALAGYIRTHYPQQKLLIGGGLITSWLRSPGWKHPFGNLFDHIIEGAGEKPLLQILKHRSNIIHSPPDFTDLPLTRYLSPGLIIPYSASSGCYWNRCSFCPEKAEGSSYSKLSSAEVLQDMQFLVEKFSPRLLHLLDNAVAPSLMKELIRQPVGVDWYGFARISPELANPGFCKKLRASGCLMLKLGIESGSQTVLDAMDKGIDLPLVEKCLVALQAAGIAVYVYLLFGTPTETRVEARLTTDFTVRNADRIGFLNLAVFNLPKNSDEKKQLQVHNFSAGDLGLYSDFFHPKGWNRKKVRNFLTDEFKAEPEIRKILQRDPPFFTSNHAVFMADAISNNKEQ